MTGLPAYLVETAVGLAVFYGLYRAFLSGDTHFQLSRLYLLGSLLVAYTLPLVHVTSPVREVVLPFGSVEGLGSFTASPAHWDWQHVVLGVYASGALFVLLRLLWHLRRLVLAMRQQPVVHQAGVRVVYVGEDCPPFSFFRTAFVHRPTEGEEPVLDQVVAHERTHIRQGHSLDILLVQLAATAQWFNPFVWLYGNALRELHEYLADRGVLAQGFDPSIYKRVLFEQHLGARSFEFAHHFRQSQIRRRLDMMTRRSGRWTLCKYLLALPALALLVVAFAEPRVVAAGGATVIEPSAAAPSAVSPAPLPQAVVKKQKADNGNGTDKAKLEADLKEKLTALKAAYQATDDPEKKKIIKAKAAELESKLAELNGAVDLNDPGSVESAIDKATKKLEMLDAKIRETTDPAVLNTLKKEMDVLSKKLEVLTARLAQLRGGR